MDALAVFGSMGSLTELFVFGSIWFWGLLALEILLLFLFVEYENGVGATISLAVFGALLYFCGQIDFIGYVQSHPLHVLGMVGLYFLFGTLWGVAKWYMFCRDRLEEYEDIKAAWLESKGRKGLKSIPDDLKTPWKEHLDRNYGYGRSREMANAPSVRDHKARIMRWMAFWVISMIWSLINDFVKRVFRAIYYRVSAFMQRVSDRIWSSTKDDFHVDDRS